MDPKYYLGSKPLEFYGIGKEYIQRAKENRLKFFNKKNDFQIVQPMTEEERKKYIAFGLDSELTAKQREQYNRSIFRPVNPEIFTPSNVPTSQAVDVVATLAPFSSVINEWLNKKGNVGQIMTVDAQKRIFILETVEQWKMRNNIKDDRTAIETLKKVTIPGKPAFYLFLDAEENIVKILNKMPQLSQVQENNIPADSVLSQPIQISQISEQAQREVQSQMSQIAKTALGTDIIITRQKEEERKLQAFKEAQKKKQESPFQPPPEEKEKMRQKLLESAIRRQRILEEGKIRDPIIKLEGDNKKPLEVEEILKSLKPEEVEDIIDDLKEIPEEKAIVEKEIKISNKSDILKITGNPKKDQEEIKRLLLLYQNDVKSLANIDLGLIITPFYNVYRNGDVVNVSSYFNAANKKRLVKDLEQGDIEKVFKDLQKQKEYKK